MSDDSPLTIITDIDHELAQSLDPNRKRSETVPSPKVPATVATPIPTTAQGDPDEPVSNRFGKIKNSPKLQRRQTSSAKETAPVLSSAKDIKVCFLLGASQRICFATNVGLHPFCYTSASDSRFLSSC